jgi:hypothetical protein
VEIDTTSTPYAGARVESFMNAIHIKVFRLLAYNLIFFSEGRGTIITGDSLLAAFNIHKFRQFMDETSGKKL